MIALILSVTAPAFRRWTTSRTSPTGQPSAPIAPGPEAVHHSAPMVTVAEGEGAVATDTAPPYPYFTSETSAWLRRRSMAAS